MTTGLTIAVAKELNETSKEKYQEAHGRLFARILLASPAGLNMDEVGSVIAQVLADIAEANEIVGYFEATALWSKDLQNIPGLLERVAGLGVRAENGIEKTEALLMRLIDGMHISVESRTSILNGLTEFKEAAKRLGYSEVAQIFAKSQQK